MGEVLRWFWLNLPDEPAAPCGAVSCTRDGTVTGGAPIFVRRLRGRRLNAVIRTARAAGQRAEWRALRNV